MLSSQKKIEFAGNVTFTQTKLLGYCFSSVNDQLDTLFRTFREN